MEFYPQTDSAPRTPSPLDATFAYNSKPLPTMTPSIYEEDNTHYIVHPHHHHQQQQQYWHPPSPPQRTSSAGSGSLLDELYNPEPLEADWQQQQQHQHQQHQHQQQQQQQTHHPRRATFPYVRQDHQPTASSSSPSSASASPSPNPYGELPLTAEPDASVKQEDTPPYLLPGEDSYAHYNVYPQVYPQQGYHPVHSHHHHPHHPQLHMQLPHHPPQIHGMPMGMPGMPQNMVGLSHPVQHTDDAASKETQFLRRRCFNCHTTEPPSWRRSTLNPGKIVCNKCGLYERTHLRPRPLRFDELRAGNKQRKNSGGINPHSPPAKKLVLGTPRPSGIARRSSVSSVGAQSNSSDWDDNVSASSSASSSVFNSPALVSHSPLPDVNELPQVEGIRLPEVLGPQIQRHRRNKSHTISFPVADPTSGYEYPSV